MTERALAFEGNKHLQTYPPKGKNYLFVIGIDQYQHHQPLHNARGDAEKIAGLLTDQYNFEHILPPLYDTEASLKNIKAHFKKIRSAWKHFEKPAHNLLIYFAGHGAIDDMEHPCWLACDTDKSLENAFKKSEILTLIEEIKALHIFVIADTCYSAHFIQNTNIFSHGDPDTVMRNQSRWYLASGWGKVPDGLSGKGSPFFQHLENILAQNQQELPCSDLIKEVFRLLRDNTQGYQPTGAPLPKYGHQNGEFVFIPNTIKRQASPPDSSFVPVSPLKKQLAGYQQYTCNRSEQFGKFFSRFDSRQPFHFCFAHGPLQESHTGLFTRFHHEIRLRMQEKQQKEFVSVWFSKSPVRLPHSKYESLEGSKTSFYRNLFPSMGIMGQAGEISIAELAAEARARNYEYVAIELKIYASEFYPGLIGWIVNEFCDPGRLPASAPGFLFFFSLVHHSSGRNPLAKWLFTTRMKLQLRSYKPVVLLDELKEVSRSDIARWPALDSLDTEDQQDILDNYFPDKFYPMNKLESLLSTVIKKYLNPKFI